MKPKRPRAESSLPIPDDLRMHPVSDDLVWLSFEHRAPTTPDGLTLAEQDVALLVHSDLSNQEIAKARGVSVKTVSNQLESIYRKLGVRSRIELVLMLQGKRPPASS